MRVEEEKEETRKKWRSVRRGKKDPLKDEKRKEDKTKIKTREERKRSIEERERRRGRS